MKRLVVCCDGTWQKLDDPYPTNVLKMAQAIRVVDDQGIPQIVHYDEGVGTGDMVDKYGGGAFGWGIDEKIQDVYRFLAFNYEEGDQIYLFGFSRGAYTVRSLAGLIYCSGLLRRQHIRKAKEAYELYRHRGKHTNPSGQDAVAFRKTYGESVDITVLGCWDTVGSLGVPELIDYAPINNLINARYRFYDTEVNQRIQKAFHAVAIDEIRRVFDVTPMRSSQHREPDQVEQVWFPGEHRCVGGGSQDTRGLSDATLEWMMRRVEPLGLSLDRAPVEDGIEPSHQVPFDNRPKGVFRLTPTLHRKVDARIDDLHQIVKLRWKDADLKYRPENLSPFARQLDE